MQFGNTVQTGEVYLGLILRTGDATQPAEVLPPDVGIAILVCARKIELEGGVGVGFVPQESFENSFLVITVVEKHLWKECL